MPAPVELSRWLMLAAALTAAPARSLADGAAPATGPILPDTFGVSGPERAATSGYLYHLHAGRIYWRALDRASGVPRSPWELYPPAGVPDRPAPGAASPPSAVVAIAADETQLMALGDDGRLYRHDDQGWTGAWGLPQLGWVRALALPDPALPWAYSSRYREVEWSEDRYGNAFHWGNAGCATVLALSHQGRCISFTDPWVGPDFSRQVCPPRHDGARIAGLAAAASTLLVITESAELFTRFYDYDSDGSTPMFRFAYFERVPRHGLPGADPASEQRTRGLPPADWRPQPPVPLPPGGRLTRRLTVIQNGKGNAARELRVLALGPGGARGYYSKALDAEAWVFRPTGEAIAAEDYLDRVAADASAAAAEVPGLHQRPYTGFAYDPRGVRLAELRVRSDDMHPHCSPVHLRLEGPRGLVARIAVHAADAWTPLVQVDVADDPWVYRRLKATLQVLELGDTAGLSPEAAALLARLRASDLEAFAWALVVSQQEAHLLPAGQLGAGGPRLVLRARPEQAARARLHLRPYTPRLEAAAIGVDAAGDAGRGVPAVDELQRLIRREREATEQQHRALVALGLLRPAASGAIELLDSLGAGNLYPKWPWLVVLHEHWPAMISAHAEAHRLYLEQSAADFRQAARGPAATATSRLGASP